MRRTSNTRRAVVTSALTLTATALLSGALAASEDPVATFEAFVKTSLEATRAARPVYFNRHHSAYAKRRFTVEHVEYDVKKTDSLVSPIVGIVKFELTTKQTTLVPTKEEAESSETWDARIGARYFLTMHYVFRDGRWSYRTGVAEVRTPMRVSLEMSPEKIEAEPTALPNVVVGSFWMLK